MRLTQTAHSDIRRNAISQNLITLRKRVNELGVAEPVIQQQGRTRIAVQLPGVQDTARAKEILGATATLEFRLVDEQSDPYLAAETGKVPLADELYYERDGNPVLLKRRVMLTGEHIIDASSGFDERGLPAVHITLDSDGARQFAKVTGENVKRLMGVVFIEQRSDTVVTGGETHRITRETREVINVARIQEQLSKRFQITGLDTSREARNLALLLRAGALATPMYIVEERTVGPSLGQQNIELGALSVLIGFLLVMVFMALYYRLFGLVADLALIANLVLIVAAMSMIPGATLTLPGIAGIVLTVGMAVDANVLIFERIREELDNGNSPQASIPGRLQQGAVDHRRREHHHPDRRDRAVCLRYRADQGICGDPLHWHRGFHVHRDHGNPGDHQPGLRDPPQPHLGGLTMRLLPRKLALDFMGRARHAMVLSGGLLVLSIGSLLFQGLNLGVDFEGGTLIEVGYPAPVELDEIRGQLGAAGFDRAVVQHFGSAQDVLVRIKPDDRPQSELSNQVLETLRGGSQELQLRRVEYVGPQVGEELRDDGGPCHAVRAGADPDLRGASLRVPVLVRCRHCADPRRDPDHRVLLADPDRIRPDGAGGDPGGDRLFPERHHRRVRPDSGELPGVAAPVQHRGSQRLDQPDSVAHPDDLADHAAGTVCTVLLRRRGDPRVLHRADRGRDHRHLLVDLRGGKFPAGARRERTGSRHDPRRRK